MGLCNRHKGRKRIESLRRFFVEKVVDPSQPCIISGSEARHMTRVLRMGPGDRFVLMDSKGARFLARIESASRQEVRVVMEKPVPRPPPSPIEIVLCQAVLKPGPMDYLIQKTSELGVDHILPFYSQRTIIQLEKDRTANRLRHWQEIAKSAAKQSGRIVPAQISPPVSLKELTAKWKEERGLKAVLWEEEEARGLKGLLRDSQRGDKFIAIVGPEGGFAREEIALFRDAGFAPLSLGNRILRSETAAITMVAIVQYEWGDLEQASQEREG
ncbi:MAG: 16S rRNA (uracil(1498)-N(3))-methyltransferase [Pseudomonadota bacterium]